MDEWYFAYGSNLYIDQKTRRTGPIRVGDEWPRIAQLAGYRLAFNKRGTGNNVYANIVRSPGEEVVGVIYLCSPDALVQMDKWEGGYERLRVTVTTDRDWPTDAITYIAKPSRVTT